MTIELEILVMAGIAIGLVSAALGYWWAAASQRRAAGGKSIAELTEQKEQYEQDVVEHFRASADLLNEMTDKYRDVYRHMAEGAQRLVPGDNVAPALAALQSGLLAAPGAPAREATIETSSNETPKEDNELTRDVGIEEVAEPDVDSADLLQETEAQEEDDLGGETQSNVEQGSASVVNADTMDASTSASTVEDEVRTDFFADDTNGVAGEDVAAEQAQSAEQPDTPIKDSKP